MVFSWENTLPPIHSQKKPQKPFWQNLSKLLLKSKQRIYMEAIHLRQNLIESITALPIDMLEELYKFINFLEYKKLSASDDSKDEILKNLKTSLKEMQIRLSKKCYFRFFLIPIFWLLIHRIEIGVW
jgi:hypothetical protein